MGSYVIITVSVGNNEYDIEIPAEVPICDIKQVFISAMKMKGLQVNQLFSFIYNGIVLPDDESFGSLGIWDGSYIQVR